jgi:hypothetical protein
VSLVSSLIEVIVNGTGVAAVKQPISGSIGQAVMEGSKVEEERTRSPSSFFIVYPNKKTHYLLPFSTSATVCSMFNSRTCITVPILVISYNNYSTVQ